MAPEGPRAVPGEVVREELGHGSPVLGRRELARDGVAWGFPLGCLGSVHGTQMPASSGTAPSTMPSSVSASRSKSPRSVRRSSRACSSTAHAHLPPLGPQAERVLVVQYAAHQVGLPGVGQRRSVFEASPSHNRPKTSATAPGSGRRASSSPSRPRKSRTTAESEDPAQHAQPPRPQQQSLDVRPMLRRGNLAHAGP